MRTKFQAVGNAISRRNPGSSADASVIAKWKYEWNRAKLSGKIAWDRAKKLLLSSLRSRFGFRYVLLGSLFILATLVAPAAHSVRVKDIAYIDGVRPNLLIGYGLVVGLDGTGDTKRVVFTTHSVSAMLSRAGIRVDPKDLILRNVAAVMVTASLPAFAQSGGRIDVTVSSIGNARSLSGGTLLLTPLNGPDGKTYALSQGSLQVANNESGSSRNRPSLNSGRVPGGGLVERTVPVKLTKNKKLTYRLRRPDFTTAQRMAKAINDAAATLGAQPNLALVLNSSTLELTLTGQNNNLANFISQVEALEVTPDVTAKVVLNGRTGTVVMGENVRISTVAVAHGGLEVKIGFRKPAVAQPAAQPGVDADGNPLPPAAQPAATSPQNKGKLKMVNSGATLNDVVEALNALGVKPRDLVSILQAMSAAGALHAQLEVI